MRRFLASTLFVAGLVCLAQAQIPNVKVVGFGTPPSSAVGGNDSCTKILLAMDGSNGATSFPDTNAGGSAHTWTATSATTSTAQVKFGSAAFLGAPGKISTPDNADFFTGSDNFTVDFWVNRNGTTGAKALAGHLFSSGLATSSSIGIGFDTTNHVVVLLAQNTGYVNGGSGFSSASTITGSAYHHVAVVRSGTSVFIFIDGLLDKTQAISGTINAGSATWAVGRMGDYTGYPDFNGYIDELRLSIGASCGARWTSNFTPPTSAYTL